MRPPQQNYQPLADNTTTTQSSMSRNWAERLENVLGDYYALKQFREWLGVDDDSSEHPLLLHFALIAYRRCVESRDYARASPLAASIYNKFLRPRAGLCQFIDAAARNDIGRRIASFPNADFLPDADLFVLCEPDLYRFLRDQHALFCRSKEFIDFYNASLSGGLGGGASTSKETFPANDGSLTTTKPNMSSADLARCAYVRKADLANASGAPLRLTANSLFRSQREREATLGQFEKMYSPSGGATRPVSRYPYVGGQATTSKNDSAVSSSFSSDATSSQLHGSGSSQYYGVTPQQTSAQIQKRRAQHAQSDQQRALRDEHRRINPASHLPFAPLCNRPATLTTANAVAETVSGIPAAAAAAAAAAVGSLLYNHGTAEGRNIFAAVLSDRLQRVLAEEQSYEEWGENAQNKECSDNNLLNTAAAVSGGREHDLDLDDDVVDAYYRRRVMQGPGAQDTSTLNSQQQTPPVVSVALPAGEESISDTTSSVKSKAFILQPPPCPPRKPRRRSQRSSSPDRLGDVIETNITQSDKAQVILTDSGSANLFSHSAISVTTTALMMSQSYIVPSAHPFAPLNVGHVSQYQPPLIYAGQEQTQKMSQSYAAYPLHGVQQKPQQPYRQQPRKGFAPPPGKTAQQCNEIYCDNDCDTSGIGSMTYISDIPMLTGITMTNETTDGLPPMQIPKVDRAAVFKRYREMGGAAAAACDSIRESKTEDIKPVQHITISCRNRASSKPESVGVPLVAHVPINVNRSMTLKEFRRHLSISSREKKRFFFQTACEDGTAPYQLLMINDNSAVLPIFEGKISAECCSVSDSE